MRTRLRKKSSDRNSASTKAGETQLQPQSRSFGDSSQSTEEVSPASSEKNIGYNFGQIEIQPATSRVIQPKPIIGGSSSKTEGGDRVGKQVVQRINVKPQTSGQTNKTGNITKQKPSVNTQSQANKAQHPDNKKNQSKNSQQPFSLYDKLAGMYPKSFVIKKGNKQWSDICKLLDLEEGKPEKLHFSQSGLGMKAIHQYRAEVTVYHHNKEKDKEPPKYEKESILSRTKKVVDQRTDERYKNLAKTLAANLSMKYEDAEKKLEEISPKKYLDWGSAGSEDAKSDIDINLRGEGTEYAVKYANDLFRKEWSKEPGIVFDVNFYARDYLPEQGMGKLISVLKAEKPETNRDKKRLNEEELKTKGITFETDFTGSATMAAADVINEEVFSLYKIRSNMTKTDWEKYTKTQLAAISSNSRSTIAEQYKAKIKAAEELYKMREDAIQKEIEILNQKSGETINSTKKNSKTDPNLKMQAEDLIYSKVLTKVEKLRDQLLIDKILVKEGKKTPEDVAKTSLELKKALYTAASFANEAYFTGASVKHVVANKQALSVKFETSEKKAKIGYSNKLALTLDEYLHSYNEQVGFIFEHLNHYKDLPKALLKSSKYIDRAMNAIKYIDESVGQKQSLPGSNSQTISADINQSRLSLRSVSGQLINIKKGRITDLKPEDIIQSLQMKTIGEFKDYLLNISAKVTQLVSLVKSSDQMLANQNSVLNSQISSLDKLLK